MGGAFCAWLIQTAPAPKSAVAAYRIPDVVVQTARPENDQTPIVGHGAVRAKNQVNIVPEVSGRLTHTHPDLAQGKVIPKGDLLFVVDPTVYEARLRQAEAEIRGFEASLARREQERVDLEGRLVNAEQMLGIERADYETSRHLYEVDKVGTQRDLDLVHQKFLRQKDVFAELKGRLAMIPHLRQEIEAQLESSKARASQAKHDLDNTEIRCPFEARVEAVRAYKSQVVTAHLSIATLTDIEAFEISVGVDPRELRWLNETIRPDALQGSSVEDGPTVKVRWAFQGQELVWEGRVTRFERIDEATRTARLVVEVRKMDMAGRIAAGPHGLQPNLSIGMFCTTDLPALTLQSALLVPRHAIYDNQWVYVFEPDPADPRSGTLGRREISMLRSVRDEVLVDYANRGDNEVCDLKPGEQVVVSPLLKPVVGMKVRMRAEELTQAGDFQLPISNFQLGKNPTVSDAVKVSAFHSQSNALPPAIAAAIGNWKLEIRNVQGVK